MSSSSNPQGADPPAYTETILPPRTALTRTLEDTCVLIHANASMMRPHLKVGPIELVTGKTRAPAAPSSGGPRSFVSMTSNVRIRVQDAPADPPASNLPSEERQASESGRHRVAGKYYAALVSKNLESRSLATEVVILGEPQDTVEEALEWMLDRTQIVVTEMLGNHRKEAQVTCCRGCAAALRGES